MQECFLSRYSHNHQKGFGLLPVLGLLAAAGALSIIIFSWAKLKWKQELLSEGYIQSIYISEAGLAQEIASQSRPLADIDSTKGFDSSITPTLTTKITDWVGRPTLSMPVVTTDNLESYLHIQSSSTYMGKGSVIDAQYGLALSDTIFRAALILTLDGELSIDYARHIHGLIYIKQLAEAKKIPGVHPLDSKFDMEPWVTPLTIPRARSFFQAIQNQLTLRGGVSGNIEFRNGRVPDFKRDSVYFAPLGGAEISSFGNDCIHIKGPGKIVTHGDIRVKGCIHLENMTLLSGGSVFFEDSVSSENILVFAARNLYIRDRSNVDGDFLARENISLSGEAQTGMHTVLASSGLGKDHAKPDTSAPKVDNGKTDAVNSETSNKSRSYGIHIRQKAKARGILIAADDNGKIIVEKDSKVLGWVLSRHEVQIDGEVDGMVWAAKATCIGSDGLQCIAGEIRRQFLPPSLSLPEKMLPPKLHKRFKIISWKLSIPDSGNVSTQ